MINYITNDEFNNDSEFNLLFLKELELLTLQLNFQQTRKQTLITYANSFAEGIDTFEKNSNVEDLLEVTKGLKLNIENANENMKKMTDLVFMLKEFISKIESDGYKDNSQLFFDDLKSYNAISAEIKEQVMKNNITIEEFIQVLYQYINYASSVIVQNASTSTVNLDNPELQEVNTKIGESFESTTYLEDSNVLLISEIQEKVFLPYKLSDLEIILSENIGKYSDVYDLINKNYIIPLDRYKNSSIARFKETFNLMRVKQKSSILKSLELALELVFKYSLHPAIISACRSLDELDIYLDCLEEEELDKFKVFAIKYEILPTKVPKKSQQVDYIINT